MAWGCCSRCTDCGGKPGIERIIESSLSAEEFGNLRKSAGGFKEFIAGAMH